MIFVLLAEHAAENCPTSNSAVRQLLKEVGPQIPSIAQKNGVKIVAGPYVNREHINVAVVETDNPDGLDRFIIESRLGHWNQVRVLPSLPLEQGFKEIDEFPAIF